MIVTKTEDGFWRLFNIKDFENLKLIYRDYNRLLGTPREFPCVVYAEEINWRGIGIKDTIQFKFVYRSDFNDISNTQR